jgi:hypothetical protein
MFVVFDLDGTLANTFRRTYSHLACPERGYPHMRQDMDWDAYFAECSTDTPYKHTIRVLKALYDNGHEVRIWTARCESVRAETNAWLLRHGVPPPVVRFMRMRPEGNRVDDFVLKQGWMTDRGRPDLVFEDRDRMVKMWRSLGIPCFQVADGNF